MILTRSGNTILLENTTIFQEGGNPSMLERETFATPSADMHVQNGTDVLDELAELGVRLENVASSVIVFLE
jgi:hypothetical protein